MGAKRSLTPGPTVRRGIMGKFTEEVQKARIDYAAGIFEKKPDMALQDVIRRVKKQFGSGMTYSTVHMAREKALEKRRMQGLRKNHVGTWQGKDKETEVVKTKHPTTVVDISKKIADADTEASQGQIKDHAMSIASKMKELNAVEVRIFKNEAGEFKVKMRLQEFRDVEFTAS